MLLSVDGSASAPWRDIASPRRAWGVLDDTDHGKRLNPVTRLNLFRTLLPWMRFMGKLPGWYELRWWDSCWCWEQPELLYQSTSSWYQLSHCSIGTINTRYVKHMYIHS
jgi:hypothetical protein